jgi:heme exporter protein B
MKLSHMSIKNSLFATLFYRTLLIAYRQSGDYFLALNFWLLMICFFALSSNASPALLHSFAPGIIWIGLLLTQLLHSTKLFREDYQEGILTELMLSPHDFFIIVLYKLLNFWIIYYVPILFIAPLLGIMLSLPPATLGMLEITILLGSPSLVMFSALVSSLTLSLKNNTLLANLLFLPFTTPILIFATGALQDASQHLSYHAPLAWLGVILLISLTLLPPAISHILRTQSI